MIDTRQTERRDRLQTIVILVVSIIVFAVLYLGVRAYEKRVSVQAVRLAIEHRVDEVDSVRASEATDIDALWSVYGPQVELTEGEFYQLAEPIIDSHQTFLPLFIALMAAGLTFITLGMLLNMKARTRRYDKIIADKESALKQSHEKLAAVMIIDELTGLINGRHFSEVLSTECRRAVRDFNPLTLMLVAIDKPERGDIDDQQVGCVADVLKEAIARPGDQVARIDPYRFALLLPSTNEQSPLLAERLCQNVQNSALAGQRLSISIGSSTLQPSALLTAETILAHTESALAEAIQCGGGQVRAHTDDSTEVPVIFT
ncbi:GGDEF domain-containing protein [Amphritea sp.]|uniref:GGDEF domain-containing protein n=1 Tax=Amphritea sp. TaxID=1872502 RepID=UPI003A951FB8